MVISATATRWARATIDWGNHEDENEESCTKRRVADRTHLFARLRDIYARTGAATPDIDATGAQTLLILEFVPKAAPMTMSPVDFDDSVGNVQVSSSSGVVVDASKFSGGDLRAEAL